MLGALTQEALISITAARLRTFLAMLGIVIGVGSVVLMLAIGSGSRKAIEDAVAKLGSNLLIVTPGSREAQGIRNTEFSRLTRGDAAALGQLPSVLASAPSTRGRAFQVAAGKQNWNTQVTGTTPEFFPIRNWVIAEGDSFTARDVKLGTRVAVIGATVAEKLFPGENALGRALRINTLPFRVVGILESKGQGFDGRDQDDVIYVPLTTAQRKLMGGGVMMENVQVIFLQAASKELMPQAELEIRELLRERHKLKEAERDSFTVRNLTAISRTATETARALSILLGSIASISLVVGGIGIMNIMLVTVTERTREIGIRKAIGASDSSIMVQFLLEAVMIAGIGSIVGLLIGAGGAFSVQKWFGLTVEISLWSVVASLAVAVVVGVLSGLYPARRASLLQPIEALRQVGG